MTEYLLQTTILPAGLVNIYLLSDETGLTVPTFQSLITNGEKTESIDVLPGEVQQEQMVLTVVEDYSIYQEGFWYKVLHSGDPQIKILLDEGSGDTVYFWGTIQDKDDVFNEKSLISGYERRSGRLRCVSMLDDLKTVTATDVVAYCVNNLAIPGTGFYSHWKFVNIKAMLASILNVGGYNATYDVTDVELPTTDECDMNRFRSYSYISEVYTDHLFSELFCPLYVGDPGVLVGIPAVFYAAYASAFEIVNEVSRTFGFIPRFRYDLSASRWRLTLLTRGSTYSADAITLPVPVKSDNLVNVDQTVTAVAITSGNLAINPPPLTWVKADVFHPNDTIVPRNVNPEVIDTALFGTFRAPAFNDSPDFWILGENNDSSNTFEAIRDIRVYRYDTGGTGVYVSLHSALCALIYYRFNRKRKGFEREYNTIRAALSGTTSHENLSLMRCSSISDGVTSKNYYITSISKNIFTNQSAVKWAELSATTVGDQADDSIILTGATYESPSVAEQTLEMVVSLDDNAVFHNDEIVIA